MWNVMSTAIAVSDFRIHISMCLDITRSIVRMLGPIGQYHQCFISVRLACQ